MLENPYGLNLFGALGAVIMALSAVLAFVMGTAGAAPERERTPVPERPTPRPKRIEDWLIDFDPRTRVEEAGGTLTSPLADSHRAVLTLHAGLDRHLSQLLARYEVPYGGVVAVEPATGRLLAYVSHSSVEPGRRDQVLDASAPSASIFKLVTSAALLDRGVRPDAVTCYHGGFGKIAPSELVDSPRRDRSCVSLAFALGSSVNVVFGKLALRHLDPTSLARYADAFGFGQVLPFDGPTEASRVEIPREPVEFARTAAGFWHTHLSPLHGAMIAATVANQGRMMRPHMVGRVVDGAGRTVARAEPALHRAVIERRTADLLGAMMRATVTSGTAYKAFHDARGTPFLPGVSVAGKTGTLSSERPYRGYSWWVGFAPADRPTIAVAALLVNSPKWRIKASFVAREALQYYVARGGRG